MIRTKRNLTIIFFFLTFAQISCRQDASTPTASNTASNKPVAAAPVQTSSNINIKAPDIAKAKAISGPGIYSFLLRCIYGNSKELGSDAAEGRFFDPLAGRDTLWYRKSTISPANVDDIKSRPDLPQDLTENFARANKTPQELAPYGVEARVLPISSNESVDKIFASAKIKDKDTKAALAFSKIGFSNDSSKALVYLEYFSEKRTLERLFFVIPLSRSLEVDRQRAIEIVPVGAN